MNKYVDHIIVDDEAEGNPINLFFKKVLQLVPVSIVNVLYVADPYECSIVGL